jgi:hypothetical protein
MSIKKQIVFHVLYQMAFVFLLLFFTQVVNATDYFGNNTTGVNFENNYNGAGFAFGDSVGFTCPGTGDFNVTSIEAQIKSAGSGTGHFRCAVYSVNRQTLYAQHSAEIDVPNTWTTATWRGGSQGITQNATLTGGTKYWLVVTYDAGDVLPGWSSYNGSNKAGYGGTDHTGGFPAPFSGTYSSYQVDWSIRVGVDAPSCNAPTVEYGSAIVCTVGVAMIVDDPTTTGTVDSIKAISTMPAGLSVTKTGASAGRVSGTPLVAVSKAAYQIRAWGCASSADDYDTITIIDTSTIPVPPINPASRCSVDVYVDMESGSNGDVLTAAILGNQDKGPAVTWTISPTPMQEFYVATVAEKALPGNVVVRSVGTYRDSVGTRGWRFDQSLIAARSVTYPVSGNPKKKASFGFFFRPGTPAGYNGYTDIVTVNTQGRGAWVQMNSTGSPNRTFMRMETNAGGNTQYGSEIVVTTGKTYWVTGLYSDSLNWAYLSVHDPDDHYTKIGESKSRLDASNDSLLSLEFGKSNPSGEYDTSSYFDDIIIDYRSGYWPLLPDTLPDGPSITSQPSNSTVNAGQTATFTVAATGTGTLAYQWYQSTTLITGATSASYTTGATTSGMSGYTYHAVVTDNNGSATSSDATLTVITAPTITVQPVKVHRLSGETATYSITATGSTPTYQWYKNGSTVGTNSNSYTTGALSISDSGHIVYCTATNAAGTATSNGVAVIVKAAPTVSVQPRDTTVVDGNGFAFTVTAARAASYSWKKSSTEMGTSQTYTGTAAFADSNSAWSCVVTNDTGTVTSNTVRLKVTRRPVTVTVDPSSQRKRAGQTASFGIVAIGTATVTYRWQVGGVDISGATASTYTTGTLSSSDSGKVFRCIVDNTAGKDTSSGAVLRVGDFVRKGVKSSLSIGNSIHF